VRERAERDRIGERREREREKRERERVKREREKEDRERERERCKRGRERGHGREISDAKCREPQRVMRHNTKPTVFSHRVTATPAITQPAHYSHGLAGSRSANTDATTLVLDSASACNIICIRARISHGSLA
jgi:hypothetical protein